MNESSATEFILNDMIPAIKVNILNTFIYMFIKIIRNQLIKEKLIQNLLMYFVKKVFLKGNLLKKYYWYLICKKYYRLYY